VQRPLSRPKASHDNFLSYSTCTPERKGARLYVPIRWFVGDRAHALNGADEMADAHSSLENADEAKINKLAVLADNPSRAVALATRRLVGGDVMRSRLVDRAEREVTQFAADPARVDAAMATLARTRVAKELATGDISSTQRLATAAADYAMRTVGASTEDTKQVQDNIKSVADDTRAAYERARLAVSQRPSPVVDSIPKIDRATRILAAILPVDENGQRIQPGWAAHTDDAAIIDAARHETAADSVSVRFWNNVLKTPSVRYFIPSHLGPTKTVQTVAKTLEIPAVRTFLRLVPFLRMPTEEAEDLRRVGRAVSYASTPATGRLHAGLYWGKPSVDNPSLHGRDIRDDASSAREVDMKKHEYAIATLSACFSDHVPYDACKVALRRCLQAYENDMYYITNIFHGSMEAWEMVGRDVLGTKGPVQPVDTVDAEVRWFARASAFLWAHSGRIGRVLETQRDGFNGVYADGTSFWRPASWGNR
jgi:hypothetical protein